MHVGARACVCVCVCVCVRVCVCSCSQCCYCSTEYIVSYGYGERIPLCLLCGRVLGLESDDLV